MNGACDFREYNAKPAAVAPHRADAERMEGVVTQTSSAPAIPDVAFDGSSTGTYPVYDSNPDGCRAQPRFMRNNRVGSCACGTRNARAAVSKGHTAVAELTREAAGDCGENCQYSSGCGWWYCMEYCLLHA
jgi:hypothetical protein